MAALIERVLLVVNPGSRRGLRHREAALRAFLDAGVEVREITTRHPGHARDVLLARTETWDAVFVLGGDGTVMEVVGALAHSNVPVGVLPGGTGNLVAGALGVPQNVGKAVRALLAGDRRPIDLGQLPDGRYFAFAAGVGVDVAMIERTTTEQKRVLGMLSYAITATRAALSVDAIDVTVEVDGVPARGRVVMAMVANAGSILGGRFTIGPDVRMDDGELDLCLFRPEGLADVVSVFWRLLRRDFRSTPHMAFVRGRTFRISTDPPVAVQADGEIVGTTPIEIVVAPRAITVLVPRDAA